MLTSLRLLAACAASVRCLLTLQPPSLAPARGACISHHDGGTFWMPPDRRRDFPLSVPAQQSLPLSSTSLLVEASPGGVAYV